MLFPRLIVSLWGITIQKVPQSFMKRYWSVIRYLLLVHLLALVVMTLFRCVQYMELGHMLGNANDASVLTAFIKGVWFDNVIACYVLLVPLVLTLLLFPWKQPLRFMKWWFAVLYVFVFMASAANIPYFSYFFKNIDSSIFGWFGYADTTAGMVFSERSYWFYIALYFVLTGLFIWAIHWLCRRAEHVWHHTGRKVSLPTYIGSTALTFFLLFLCIFGIRGRTGYNPIKISQAYYCNDPFLNQLGINPMFNLLTSALDDMRKENRELQLMPYKEALAHTRKYLGIDTPYDSLHVMDRRVETQDKPLTPNIVMILMESMSADLLQTFGQKEQLTPTLDSLYNHALAFTHCYSAGIHTNHGITATLYSYPALMFRNLMKGTVTPHHDGLPTVLRQYGYHNLFFMTHESQYDNMNAFLRTNGFDEVFALEDYPKKEQVNAFGVPDKYLFDYALPVLNERAKGNTPFFATLLTISNHPPYIIPEWFKPKTSQPETQIVEYADYCIGHFLAEARRQPWYDNTLFIILADHGKLVGQSKAELPQSFNHIPLLIFGPGIDARRYDGLTMQVDVMPTVLGLLHMSYNYDGFGQNLLQQPRSQVFYTSDTQIVGRDSKACFIYNPKAEKYFHYEVLPDGQLRPSAPSKHFDALKDYAFSMIQTAEYLYRH